jgi:hypothetical protein
MARTKAVLGAGARLSDYISASLLARVYPTELIDRILDEQGRNSRRVRSFPATVGVYYCMALSLYPEAAYEEVFAVLAQGLAWARSSPAPAVVAKSSISELRSKIGAEPLRMARGHAWRGVRSSIIASMQDAHGAGSGLPSLHRCKTRRNLQRWLDRSDWSLGVRCTT